MPRKPRKGECRCEPCPRCGYLHYCNVSIDHRETPVRIGGCPAEKL